MTIQALDRSKNEPLTHPDSELLAAPSSLKPSPISTEIQKIIEENLSPFTEKPSGFSAFDEAVFSKDHLKIARLFHLNQEKFETSSKANQSLLEIKDIYNNRVAYATRNSLISEYILAGSLPILSQYLKNSPYIFDFNQKNAFSSLHFAAMGLSKEMISLLCNHEFSIDAKDEKGRTPLHYAALNPEKEVFLKLLEKGADILKKDVHGVTPLDLLMEESKKNDPLHIPTEEKLVTLLLLVTECVKMGVKGNYFDENTEVFAQALSYLTPFSQIALLLKGSSYSKKNILISSALYFVAQNFTLSRLALNSFILAKVASSALFCLKDLYTYGPTRPLDTFKKVGIKFTQCSIIGYNFVTKYSLDYFRDLYNDLASPDDAAGFFSTATGEDFYDEYKDFSSSLKEKFDPWYLYFKERVTVLSNQD